LVDRPQKITLGEMRASGVRGLLIYCSDFKCSHWISMNVTNGPTRSGCPIWSRYSFVGRAGSEEPT